MEAPLHLPNPAQVPKRSPFRYPGGKTAFVPLFREWLLAQEPRKRFLVEPFAGGRSVGLEALPLGAIEELLLVEIAPEVSLVWEALFGGGAEALAEAVLRFPATPEAVEALLRVGPRDRIEGPCAPWCVTGWPEGASWLPGSGRSAGGRAGRAPLPARIPRR